MSNESATKPSEPYVKAAIEAVLGIVRGREARDAMPRLKIARQQAIWDLYHDSRLNHLEVEERLRADLSGMGLSDDEIWGLGVSHDNILRVAGTRRRPKPRPS